MEELSFKKNVPDVRQTQDVPVIQSKETVKQNDVPDVGNAARTAAQQSNSLSFIGSEVAQKTNQALATKLGYEQGLNPNGNEGFPITDFDKTFAQSYNTQAQSSLSLLGKKLITSSALELAKAPRLSLDLIDKSQMQTAQGLKKITDLAPDAIKGQLSENFGSQLLSHSAELQSRMLSEQRQDDRDLTFAATTQNTETINELATKGNINAAGSTLDATKNAIESAYQRRVISRTDADVKIKTAEQSLLNGKYAGQLLQARKENKEAQFLKDFSDSAQPDLTFDQKQMVSASLLSFASTIKSLNNQAEQLSTTKFSELVTKNPANVSDDQLLEFKNSVSPETYERGYLELLKARKTFNTKMNKANELANSFNDNTKFPYFTAEQKNDAFNIQVSNEIDNSAKNGNPITAAEAKVRVATYAAGEIPGFVKELDGQFTSTNPALLEQSTAAVQSINAAKKGQNIGSLDSQSINMMYRYQALKRSMIPQDAANEAHQQIYSKTSEQTIAVNKAWDAHLSNLNISGVKENDFALNVANIPSGVYMRNKALIGDQLKNAYRGLFFAQNGDSDTAKTMLSDYAKQVYGTTNVNGPKTEYTFSPVEQVLNLPADAAPVIQDDLRDQVTKQFETSKKNYDAGLTHSYYEVKQGITTNDVRFAMSEIKRLNTETYNNAKKSLLTNIQQASKIENDPYIQDYRKTINEFHKANPVQVIKRYRDGRQEETYDLAIEGSSSLSRTNNPSNPIAGGYIVYLASKNGLKSISLDNPLLGDVTYMPQSKKINMNYGSIQHVYTDVNLTKKEQTQVDKLNQQFPELPFGTLP